MALDLSAANGHLFENITQAAQFTFNENALMKNLVTMYDMQGTPGMTASVPVYPKASAVGAAGADLSDDSALDTMASVDIAAQEFGNMTTLQDIVAESSPLSVAQDVGRVLGEGIAQAMDEVIVDLFNSGAITEVGPGAGGELTIEHLLKAGATLRNASVPMSGLVAVLHPLAAFNLKKSLLNSGGSIQQPVDHDGSSNAIIFGGSPDLQNQAGRDYFLGTVAGIRIFESASIDVDGSGDAVSAVFHPGAIGLVMKRDLRIATQRDESKRATEIVATAAFGAARLSNAKIAKITSDATL
tara:strand:+ start:2954 stop:3850 length:897 start_codon:yes stop_codon:yes gene_type:complete